MKTANKILIALTAMGVVATQAHADSFRDALTNGDVWGELRNTYTSGSNSSAASEAGALNNSNVLGSALLLGYKTGSYHGFNLGLAFQKGHDWGVHDDDAGLTVQGGEDDARVSIDTASLYQAYIDYTFDLSVTDTRFRLGRQKIVSPLVMNSGAFPMQDSFDALVIENKDIADTSIRLMGIDQWNMRYGGDSNGSVTQEDKNYDETIYSVYVQNNSIDGLNVEAQWFDNGNDDPTGDPPTAPMTADAYSTGFLGLTYRVPGTSWMLGAKALEADYEDNPDTGYWGVKAGTDVAGVDVQLSYTSVRDDANFPGTLGHVPMFRSYSPGFGHEFYAGLDTTTLSLGHGLGISGLDATLGYSDWSQSDAGIANSGVDLDGGYELHLDVSYDIKAVEGLHASLKASHMGFDQGALSDDELDYMRLSVNYAF